MDFEAKLEEIVIVSLIFGVRAVSALSERAVIELAEHVKEDLPRLAECLTKSRFVDDLLDSCLNLKVAKEIMDSADYLFESVGMGCKGWSMSGSDPHPDVTKDVLSGGIV